jgi:predicted small lipoprotein YifL
LLLAGAAAGCGQQGPLVLPDSARPVERIDPPPAEPDQNDDDQQNER